MIHFIQNQGSMFRFYTLSTKSWFTVFKGIFGSDSFALKEPLFRKFVHANLKTVSRFNHVDSYLSLWSLEWNALFVVFDICWFVFGYGFIRKGDSPLIQWLVNSYSYSPWLIRSRIFLDCLEHKCVKCIFSILRKTHLKTRNSMQVNGGSQIQMQFSLSKNNVGIKRLVYQLGNVQMFHNMQKSQIPQNVT